MNGSEEKAEFSFGGPAPPCPSFFFPYDPKEEIKQIKEKDEQDDSPQPS